MTTNRKLTIGIIVLLFINLVILGFFIFNHKDCNNTRSTVPKGPAQTIIKKLDFNKEQIEDLKTLKTSHMKYVRAKDEEIKAVKKVIFNSLGHDNGTNIDSLSTIIGAIQKDIETSHYHHFLKIKALCKGDQVEKFNELSKELSEIFSTRRQGRTNKK
ncbi:hypothetical protein SCB49_03079 [unidentified eubacterium SCB49]|nr:hypothetical protein SCB49_03079 [unidentified eubacterium SCB49]